MHENLKKWFNPNKSNVIVFGTLLFKTVEFNQIKQDKIEYVDKIKILGFKFNAKNVLMKMNILSFVSQK